VLRLRHPVSLLVICVLVMLGVLRSYSPPTPVGADAPDVVFSAIRAEAILRELLQEGVPHVAGSQANAVVRDRAVAQLASAGYETEIQARFQCNPNFGSCSPVENIIAVKPGSEGRFAVLLTAHYDSGWTGPGASDDGAGTSAILEIARMAADFPPFRNDVVFLISDSEENGLIGARAFAEHHPLFGKVKAVINLEARGASGASVMFETGEGNRSIIRMYSKNVKRPVANSLIYEIYKRMPNDTDFSVYRDRGVMGLNFAFAQGVPVYHSSIDDPDHLDLGSLQHHGDNAWAMLKALGERDLNTINSREDAGYIDIFAKRLSHYPISITGGLGLVLGVWVMIAIGLAFRKDFRYGKLRWGLVAIPFLLAFVVIGAYLLSWPLGRWPDLHPLEHPFPWIGRLAIFLMVALAIYSTLKLFSERVSACAWMILAWGLIFVLGMVLTNQLPSASHIALLPLALFGLGSLIDLFRKKSPAPLLMASVLGFATTAFISFYHFFMLDVVMNFDKSHFKAIPLWMMTLTVMPMLLAYVKKRDLSWQPARWLSVVILTACFVHLFLPGFTAERPRDMTLMYSEVEGSGTAHVVLESLYRRHDAGFAKGHAFEMKEINSGRLGTVRRPVREVAALGLNGLTFEQMGVKEEEGAWRRELQIGVPENSPMTILTLAAESGLQKAWIDGELAFEASTGSNRRKSPYSLQLIHPGSGLKKIELLTTSSEALKVAAVSWHDLPPVLVAPFMGNWPDDSRPFLYGPRAEKIQEFELSTVTGLEVPPSN
jgi:hypothetical protein